MKPGNATQDLIEETLQSLDGISRAEAPAFFYTRLQARLDKQQEPGASWWWFGKPAFSFATLALLLVLNVAALTRYLKKSDQPVQQTTGIQGFAKEYDLDAVSLYSEKDNP
ncbi:MAG: hypothetical protein JO301_15875 [Chitinophagaceae bacterium]|nr:hypothetical protein [Chitinophagaceae bacterium]